MASSVTFDELELIFTIRCAWKLSRRIKNYDLFLNEVKCTTDCKMEKKTLDKQSSQ